MGEITKKNKGNTKKKSSPTNSPALQNVLLLKIISIDMTIIFYVCAWKLYC